MRNVVGIGNHGGMLLTAVCASPTCIILLFPSSPSSSSTDFLLLLTDLMLFFRILILISSSSSGSTVSLVQQQLLLLFLLYHSLNLLLLLLNFLICQRLLHQVHGSEERFLCSILGIIDLEVRLPQESGMNEGLGSKWQLFLYLLVGRNIGITCLPSFLITDTRAICFVDGYCCCCSSRNKLITTCSSCCICNCMITNTERKQIF